MNMNILKKLTNKKYSMPISENTYYYGNIFTYRYRIIRMKEKKNGVRYGLKMKIVVILYVKLYDECHFQAYVFSRSHGILYSKYRFECK